MFKELRMSFEHNVRLFCFLVSSSKAKDTFQWILNMCLRFDIVNEKWQLRVNHLPEGAERHCPPLPPRLIKGTIQFYSWPFWNYCCVSPFWIPQGISGGRKQILTQNLHFKLEVLLLKFLFLSMYLNFPINSKLVYLNVPDSMMKLVKF